MKPLHHLMVVALKDALIVISAFTLYEMIAELKEYWHANYPNSVDSHVHYGRLLHLTSIFVADFAIGCIIYYAFHIIS
jgi:hypothetical protein